MNDKFLVMKHWLDKIKPICNREQYEKLAAILLDYGIYGIESEIKDPVVDMAFSFVKEQIDNMQSSYAEKAEYGKKIGRKGAFSEIENETIYELACKGYRVKEIAEKMQIIDERKIKAIYNSSGWKNRIVK